MRQLRIAVPVTLSGPRAAYGNMVREVVAEFANIADLNIELFDDKADPAFAATLASTILTSNSDVVVGHFNSDCARVAAPIYAAKGLPLVLPASTALGIPDGRNVFRVCSDEDQEAREIVVLINKIAKDREVCVWCDGSSYSRRIRDQVEAIYGAPLENLMNIVLRRESCNLVVLYFGSHVSIMNQFASEGMSWGGVSVCCDDCSIDDFLSRARPNTWVCMPNRPYSNLVKDSILIVDRILRRRDASWQDFFDISGNCKDASWTMRLVTDLR